MTSRVLRLPAPPPRAATRGGLALDLAALDQRPRTGEPSARDDGLDALAQRFLQAVVEIVGADRPVAQLLRWATPAVYAEVCRQADTVAASSDTRHRARTGRPRVVSVHVTRPAEGVAEVAAHVRHAGRSRALAARLEHRRDRWLCTALQLG